MNNDMELISSIEVIEVRREPPVFTSRGNALKVCPVCWPGNLIFLPFPDLRRFKVPIDRTVCVVCEAKRTSRND